MKLFNTITAGLLLCAGLASCEMKDELRGVGEGASEVGYLDLSVSVNASQNEVARAEVSGGDVNVGEPVSADDFPVTITGVTDATYKKEYTNYAELKAENGGRVELPVGDYTVTAHTNATLTNDMDAPYYEGTQPITIKEGVNAPATVTCTMKNTEINLIYNTEFRTKFKSCKIKITGGTTIIYVECTDLSDGDQINPKPIYMLIPDGVEELRVDVWAVNEKGEEVHEYRTLTKPDGDDTTEWTGGDALTITMDGYTPTEDEETGITGSGITINANVKFEETEDKIEVPVTPGGSTEEPGGEEDNNEEPQPPITDNNKPTLSGEYLNKTVNFSKTANNCPNIEVLMTAPNGIKYVYIKATTSDKENLEPAFSDLGLTTGNGLDLVTATQLATLIDPLPKAGETSYPFKLGALANMLTVGEHSFTVTVVDQENISSEPATLYFTVTE